MRALQAKAALLARAVRAAKEAAAVLRVQRAKVAVAAKAALLARAAKQAAAKRVQVAPCLRPCVSLRRRRWLALKVARVAPVRKLVHPAWTPQAPRARPLAHRAAVAFLRREVPAANQREVNRRAVRLQVASRPEVPPREVPVVNPAEGRW